MKSIDIHAHLVPRSLWQAAEAGRKSGLGAAPADTQLMFGGFWGSDRLVLRRRSDRAGNVALHPPMLEGVWGALGARRGAIVTVERVVDDLRPWIAQNKDALFTALLAVPKRCPDASRSS